MKDIVVGFFRFTLWTSFVLSLAKILISPVGDEYARVEDYRMSLPGVSQYDTPEKREARYLRKLGQAVNPYGLAPLILVLSAGFLALLEVGSRILAKLTDLTALTEAGLDESAAAMQRAARLGPAAVAAEALIAGGLAAAARKPKGEAMTTMARPPMASVSPKPKSAV
jgi:hypothetical protein